jgi:hypothetical protein
MTVYAAHDSSQTKVWDLLKKQIPRLARDDSVRGALWGLRKLNEDHFQNYCGGGDFVGSGVWVEFYRRDDGGGAGSGVSLERRRVGVARAGGAVYCGVWISLGAVSGYEAEEGRDQIAQAILQGLKPLFEDTRHGPTKVGPS